VFDADWIEPGTHIGFIRPNEVPADLWTERDIDTFAVSTANQSALESSLGSGYVTEREGAADPWQWVIRPDDPPYPKTEHRSREPKPIDQADVVRFPELMGDDSLGRSDPSGITLFAQRGDGIAFAAVGHALYEIAEEKDLGESIPPERFTQAYVP
jgi:ornithine cyclodeaminase/alanine dehydrogenase-like protein (mu-crystallin family)